MHKKLGEADGAEARKDSIHMKWKNLGLDPVGDENSNTQGCHWKAKNWEERNRGRKTVVRSQRLRATLNDSGSKINKYGHAELTHHFCHPSYRNTRARGERNILQGPSQERDIY